MDNNLLLIAMKRVSRIRDEYGEMPISRVKKSVQELVNWMKNLQGEKNLQIRFPLKHYNENLDNLLNNKSLFADILDREFVTVVQIPRLNIIRHYSAIQCEGILIGLTADLAKFLLEEKKSKIDFLDWLVNKVPPISLAEIQ